MRLWTILAVAAFAVGLSSTSIEPAQARSGLSPGRVLGVLTSPLRAVLRGPRARLRSVRSPRNRGEARAAAPRRGAREASLVGLAGAPVWPTAVSDIFVNTFEPAAGTAVTIAGDSEAPAATRPVAVADAEDLCARSATPDIAIGIVERIEQLVQPTGPQRDQLKPMRVALTNAMSDMIDACETATEATAPERLEAMRERIRALQAAVLSVRAPLEQFYNSLTDAQRSQLDGVASDARGSGLLRQCRQALAAVEWPRRRIERALRPTDEQRVRLEALRKTVMAMADYLAPSCPAEVPPTVPARLDAAADWLDAMLYAAMAVDPALRNAYDSLDDAQKTRFDALARRSNRGDS
jgi:hypothetical protein